MPDLTVFGLPAEPSFNDIERWEGEGGAVPLEPFPAPWRFAHRLRWFDTHKELAVPGEMILAG